MQGTECKMYYFCEAMLLKDKWEKCEKH